MGKSHAPVLLHSMAVAKLAATNNDIKIAGFEPLLSLKQVSKILGYSTSTIRRRVAEGALSPVQDHKGAQLRFRPAEIRRYVATITGQNI
ncbi:hypothetical protein WV31_19080 [Magnetospirillum sp. ME-1]|uniref:helix-turn-helix domain-containing protein n=1 Tax=Magnetospirillum sp. ME-1 TaxID=1639348 RepID=UPI000A17E0E7|nr:helix-turn-helix domain-containing protein [Magnetospirillum sp. ME-1]ARJ67607.1 hypothetical protein WV31_19080 [Magnetospirillum sp. ME-1]